MSALSAVPGWARCFLLTLIVYLLQLFPVPGVFLMIVAAAYWSIILINLGFVLLARDALNGRAPRWALLVPAMWFGGYLIIAGVSHWQATRFITGIDAANAGKRAAFDPMKQDLLILGDAPYDLSANSFLSDHGLSRIFTLQETQFGPRYETVYALTALRCPAETVLRDQNGDPIVYQRAVSPDPGDDWGRSKLQFATELCQLRGTGHPEQPTVTIKAGNGVSYRSWWLKTVRYPLTISSPSGTTVVEAGQASPLSWVPQPVLGCALNSGAPKWECFAGFLHGFGGPSFQRQPVKVASRALSLPTVSLRQRYPNAGWR